MDTGVEVKVEEYDGTYECLFCGESVRGQPALKCLHCSSNPFHVACVARADSKYAEVCPTCDRKTVEAWVSASGGAVAPSEIIDLRELESEGESGRGKHMPAAHNQRSSRAGSVENRARGRGVRRKSELRSTLRGALRSNKHLLEAERHLYASPPLRLSARNSTWS